MMSSDSTSVNLVCQMMLGSDAVSPKVADDVRSQSLMLLTATPTLTQSRTFPSSQQDHKFASRLETPKYSSTPNKHLFGSSYEQSPNAETTNNPPLINEHFPLQLNSGLSLSKKHQIGKPISVIDSFAASPGSRLHQSYVTALRDTEEGWTGCRLSETLDVKVSKDHIKNATTLTPSEWCINKRIKNDITSLFGSEVPCSRTALAEVRRSLNLGVTSHLSPYNKKQNMLLGSDKSYLANRLFLGKDQSVDPFNTVSALNLHKGDDDESIIDCNKDPLYPQQKHDFDQFLKNEHRSVDFSTATPNKTVLDNERQQLADKINTAIPILTEVPLEQKSFAKIESRLPMSIISTWNTSGGYGVTCNWMNAWTGLSSTNDQSPRPRHHNFVPFHQPRHPLDVNSILYSPPSNKIMTGIHSPEYIPRTIAPMPDKRNLFVPETLTTFMPQNHASRSTQSCATASLCFRHEANSWNSSENTTQYASIDQPSLPDTSAYEDKATNSPIPSICVNHAKGSDEKRPAISTAIEGVHYSKDNSEVIDDQRSNVSGHEKQNIQSSPIRRIKSPVFKPYSYDTTEKANFPSILPTPILREDNDSPIAEVSPKKDLTSNDNIYTICPSSPYSNFHSGHFSFPHISSPLFPFSHDLKSLHNLMSRNDADLLSSIPEKLPSSLRCNVQDLRKMANHVYFCHLCRYSGILKEEFDRHMQIHFEYNCPYCDYTSRTEGRLKRHIKDFHSESESKHRSQTGRAKVLRCKHCQFFCVDKTEFWAHARLHIKEEKLLACPQCPFVTEYKHHLEYHLRNHFGSKPYKCVKCNYSCVNKSMLNSHMKSHTNVYQYRCSNCTYATKYCHSLKLHLRKYQHNPATILNSDGSVPLAMDPETYGLSCSSRRGPPRGPRGLQHEEESDGEQSTFNLPKISASEDTYMHSLEDCAFPTQCHASTNMDNAVLPFDNETAIRDESVALPSNTTESSGLISGDWKTCAQNGNMYVGVENSSPTSRSFCLKDILGRRMSEPTPSANERRQHLDELDAISRRNTVPTRSGIKCNKVVLCQKRKLISYLSTESKTPPSSNTNRSVFSCLSDEHRKDSIPEIFDASDENQHTFSSPIRSTANSDIRLNMRCAYGEGLDSFLAIPKESHCVAANIAALDNDMTEESALDLTKKSECLSSKNHSMTPISFRARTKIDDRFAICEKRKLFDLPGLSSEETVSKEEVFTQTRKRSRKGKAYKLDELFMKRNAAIGDNLGVRTHDNDEECSLSNINQFDCMSAAEKQQQFANGESTPTSNTHAGPVSKKLQSCTKDEQFQQLQNDIDLLNNDFKVQRSLDENPSVHVSRIELTNNLSATDVNTCENEDANWLFDVGYMESVEEKERISLARAIMENRSLRSNPSVKRGTEVALKLLMDDDKHFIPKDVFSEPSLLTDISGAQDLSNTRIDASLQCDVNSVHSCKQANPRTLTGFTYPEISSAFNRVTFVDGSAKSNFCSSKESTKRDTSNDVNFKEQIYQQAVSRTCIQKSSDDVRKQGLPSEKVSRDAVETSSAVKNAVKHNNYDGSPPNYPFHCIYCGVGFQGHLMHSMHMSLHREDKGRPFECQCGSVSKDGHEFQLHLIMDQHK